jgi:hypothetical protein
MCNLTTATEAEADNMQWERVRANIQRAVTCELPAHGTQEWRRADPAALADRIVTHIMAGLHPSLSSDQVANGVRMMRGVLEKAGIDPASLPWV